MMAVHCEAKKVLKKFTFSLKFVITLLFIIGEESKENYAIIKRFKMD